MKAAFVISTVLASVAMAAPALEARTGDWTGCLLRCARNCPKALPLFAPCFAICEVTCGGVAEPGEPIDLGDLTDN